MDLAVSLEHQPRIALHLRGSASCAPELVFDQEVDPSIGSIRAAGDEQQVGAKPAQGIVPEFGSHRSQGRPVDRSREDRRQGAAKQGHGLVGTAEDPVEQGIVWCHHGSSGPLWLGCSQR